MSLSWILLRIIFSSFLCQIKNCWGNGMEFSYNIEDFHILYWIFYVSFIQQFLSLRINLKTRMCWRNIQVPKTSMWLKFSRLQHPYVRTISHKLLHYYKRSLGFIKCQMLNTSCVGFQEKLLIKEELETNYHVMLSVSRD